MTNKGRPKTFENHDAIKKAQQLFWDKGYEATSLSDLIDTMGISRQSMYNTFGNKNDLFILCLEAYVEEGYENFKSIFNSNNSAKEIYLEFSNMFISNNCQSNKGCFVSSAIQEMATKDERVKNILEMKYSKNYQIFLDFFESSISKKELESDLSAKELADVFDSLLLSVASLCKLPNRSDQIKNIFKVFEKQLHFN